jgi:hypothetical protein
VELEGENSPRHLVEYKLQASTITPNNTNCRTILLPSLYAWYVLPFSSRYRKILEPIEAEELPWVLWSSKHKHRTHCGPQAIVFSYPNGRVLIIEIVCLKCASELQCTSSFWGRETPTSAAKATSGFVCASAMALSRGKGPETS